MSLQPYSLLVVALILVVLVAAIFFRNKPRPADIIAFIIIMLGIVAVYFYIRPTQTPLMGEAAKVQSLIGQGKPVVLEFQSPY